MEAVALIGGLVGLTAFFAWRWAKAKARAAEAEQRAEAVDANVEHARDAERILDAPLSLRDRVRRAAARRRMRREFAASRLEGAEDAARDDREGGS